MGFLREICLVLLMGGSCVFVFLRPGLRKLRLTSNLNLLCSQRWSGTPDPPSSTSGVLGLEICAITYGS